ncbi:MAG: TonB-dependent receptor [Acidobacteria bacterium]|nr:TonB-dependent receptor [Acidobacteriota bacterium]
MCKPGWRYHRDPEKEWGIVMDSGKIHETASEPRAAVLLGVWLLAYSTVVFAQVGTGTISGTVRDETNAVIAGATVTVTNTGQGVTRRITTNAQGRYSAPNLEVGNYEVRVEATGFQSSLRSGLSLSVGREAVVDFLLPVGQVAETVTVTGEAPLVETTTTAVSALVDQSQMRDLPLNGRNYDQLTLLTTGVQQYKTGQSASFMGRGLRISVAGARPEGQAILLDGANIQGFWNLGAGASIAGTTLGVEAIREFETVTNNSSAEFARAGGAVINAVTRSGTNAFHGSLFEFHRNDNLDARNFFQPGKDAAPFVRNQFGVAVGGPIRENKTFFFGTYEGLRERLSLTRIARVPDALARQGLLPDPSNPGSFLSVGVNDRIRPFLDVFPLPNGRNFGNGTAELISSRNRPIDEDYWAVRIDHNFSERHLLFGRYSFDDAVLVEPYSNTDAPGFPEDSKARNQYTTIEGKAILSPSLLNVSRFSFVRTKHTAFNSSQFTALEFFPGLNRQLGTIAIGGIGSVGASILTPFQFVVNTFTVSDDMSLTRGSHSMKFGFELQRIQNNYFLDFFSGGQYTFNSLREFLANQPFSFIGALPGKLDTQRGWRQTLFGFYFQDNYRVRDRLTLNLGLRYEFTTNPTEANGKLFHLKDPLKDPEFVPVEHVFANNPSLRNFGPRFGFAWDVFGDQKTSLRGGFGIYFNQILPRTYAHIAFNPPFTVLGFSLFPTFPNPLEKGVAGLAPSVSPVTNHIVNNTPYMMQYNLNGEREILPATVLRIGYVGSRGVHLFLGRDWNAFVSQRLPDGRLIRPVGSPRPNPRFGNLALKTPDANSAYNSLQIAVNKRLRQGLQFQVSYTFSKSIDDMSATFISENLGSPDTLMEPTGDRSRDRGLSNFDIRNNLTANFIYALPFGVGRWYGGWQFSNIMTLSSGAPFTIQNAFDRGNTGSNSRHDRPDLRPGRSNNPRLDSPDQWFDPSAFSLQEAGTFGNLGRNTAIGPGLVNFDFAVLKDAAIPRVSEEFAVQFRAEFFNIFNRPNFGIPVRTNLAVFTDASGVPNPSAGRLTETITNSRQIQLGLKVIF